MAFMLELELQKVRLRGHDHFWDVMRDLGKDGTPFTLKDVVGASNAHHSTVDDYIKRLQRAGIITTSGKHGEGHWAQKLYRLLETPRETPSLRRDGTQGNYGQSRQNMWNVIRGPNAREGISAADLAMLAATDDVTVSEGSASEFMRRLHNAGYLIITENKASRPIARHRRYRLKPSMNSGPLAPKLLRSKIVYDPNNRTVVGDVVAEEEAA